MPPPDPNDKTLRPDPDRTVPAAPPAHAPAPLPERIGEYRILGKLGEGGMGVVYEAEQRSPRRRVALKVVRGGLLVRDDSLRMFRREAETLARLRHPHIAAIYESGRTGDGQHFFAMELVRGALLDEHLRARPDVDSAEDVRYRLDLFRKIADAVHYAHQRAVIHRDLKPSNIVVSEEVPSGKTSLGSRSPEVKILDFGLARITEEDVGAASMATEVGTIKGTLAFMSPEQARGTPDEIDVRSDVYSLGVILYGMLTGQPPYPTRDKSLVEAVSVICEEPPRSFTKLGAARRLRGDLETIVRKALEKDADRRYKSAAALSDDVGRYVASQPIQARPPSTAYVLRKFAGRNRAFVGAAAGVFLALAVGAGVSAWQAGKATREARKAEAVNAFLHEMFAAASPMSMTREDPDRGRKITVHQILDEAGRRLESGDLADQQEVEAAVRLTIGTTYRDLGDYESARAHLARSLEIRERTLRDDDPEIAESLDALAEVLQLEGELEEPEPMFQRALDIRRQRLGSEDAATAATLHNLGDLFHAQGRTEEAEATLRSAVALRRKVLGPDHVDTAASLNALASVLQARGEIDQAEDLLRQALEIRRSRLGDRHPEVARTLHDLALILDDRGDLEGAESALRESVDIWRDLLGDSHTFLWAALANLGVVLKDQGKLGDAEDTLRESLEVLRRNVGGDEPSVGASLYNLARVQQAQGKLPEAEANARESLGILREALPPGHPTLAGVMAGLGSVLVDRGEGAEAEPLLRESLAIYDEAAPGKWYGHQVRSVLGEALLAQRRFREAEPLLLAAWEGLKDDPAVSPDRKRSAVARIARLYQRWNRVLPDAGRVAAAAEWSRRLESLTE